MEQNFYVLSEGDERYYVDYYEKNEMLPVNGNRNHQFYSVRPLRFFVRPRQRGDMLWAPLNAFFISNRLHLIFQEAGITGYDALPADAKLVYEHSPDEAVYWQVAITGWGGMASSSAGLSPRVGVDSPHVYSRSEDAGDPFDRSQWDGSDFFIIWPYVGFCCITQRVVDLLKENKIKHYSIYDLATYSFGGTIGPIAPCPLRCIFSEERAKKIGEPLGIYWWE